MCGIAGALDRTGTRPFPQHRLVAMLAAIAHRGPDDERMHFEPGLSTGARRLSIVDVQCGSQPMSNEDGTVWVTFNGELFDHVKLRRDLLARGHDFRTRCDTEAWVHLYEEHGLGMLDLARGQFATSVWDRPRRRLILARDRFGICPLYYAEQDGWLLWASEIKALLASGLIHPRPDARAIDHFFNFFAPPPARTCFEGVHMLPPGFCLVAADARVQVKRYWDLDFPRAGEERRSGRLVDELDNLIHQAVERRLRSDVPVACYVSGGLDSTVVLGTASRQRNGGVQSFTIRLRDGAGVDEAGPAAETARLFESPLSILSMDTAGIADAYPELTAAAEAPVLDTSCAAMMRLAAVVRQHGFKVVLTGEGADEALAGYPWFKAQKLFSAVPAIIRERLPGLPVSGSPHVETAQHLMSGLAAAARPHLYSRDMWLRLQGYNAWEDLGIDWSRMKSWHRLNRSLYVGYKVTLAGMQLFSKGDRITMHSSVEARYPYLDEDFVDWCATIAPEYKLRGFREKWILREMAARSLPPKLARRPKTMFRAKLAPTFFGPHRPGWVDQLLSPESLQKAGWFNPAAVARARTQKFHPRGVLLDFGLTCVVAVQLWHHVWCGGGLCELPAWSARQ